MLGIRYAGEKLRQMDDAYAHQIANVLNSRPAGAMMADNSDFVAGMAAPFSMQRDIRASFNNMPMTAANRDEVLRQVFAGDVGAASRYAIPAAGIAAAGVGINAMMNNGEQHQAPDIDQA